MLFKSDTRDPANRTIAGFILSTFLGLVHSKNTQFWIEFETQSSEKSFFVHINQDFIVYLLKEIVFHCLNIFSKV